VAFGVGQSFGKKTAVAGDVARDTARAPGDSGDPGATGNFGGDVDGEHDGDLVVEGRSQ
jgi:hypothetical protein